MVIVCCLIWFNQVSCSTFSCSSCADQQLVCNESESCSLDCTATNSCQNVTITCADNQDCTISCTVEDGCNSMTIYGENAAYLDIVALGKRSLKYSTIICPESSNSNCLIRCGEVSCTQMYVEAIGTNMVNLSTVTTSGWAFASTTINCTRAGFLHILAKGYGALENTKIYCPNNGAYVLNGKEPSCIIDSTLSQWWSGEKAKIYAVEGFNDVELYGIGFYHEGNDILYCMLNYSKSCDIDGTSSSNIHCDSNSDDGMFCQDYLLPSAHAHPS